MNPETPLEIDFLFFLCQNSYSFASNFWSFLMKRTLCSWIGETDWLVQEGKPRKEDDLGPILRTVIDEKWADQIGEVRLLNNYPGRRSAEFKKWLSKKTKAKIVCKDVKLSSPTNFTEVDRITIELLRSLPDNPPLLFLCSAGTFVMSAVLILISHNQFPAMLIEASEKGGVKEIDVPFNISVRDLIERADRARGEISGGRREYLPDFEAIKYDCRKMRDAVAKAASLANRGINLLLEGETGTGRELLARCIHKKSKKDHFDVINCSAYMPEQLERELFGTVREDAKSGETRETRGLFRKSRSSTLYISEVDTLPAYLQTRLVQEIDREAQVTRQRLIFSSSLPIADAVAVGSFRRDLFYRITGDVITLPPLRERGLTDLRLITEHLIRELKLRLKNEDAKIPEKQLDRSAQETLWAFPFDGNVRELETVLARAMINTEDNTIRREDIERTLELNRGSHIGDGILNRPLRPAEVKYDPKVRDDYVVLDHVLEEVRQHYLGLAKASHRSIRKRANALGINYQTLAYRENRPERKRKNENSSK